MANGDTPNGPEGPDLIDLDDQRRELIRGRVVSLFDYRKLTEEGRTQLMGDIADIVSNPDTSQIFYDELEIQGDVYRRNQQASERKARNWKRGGIVVGVAALALLAGNVSQYNNSRAQQDALQDLQSKLGTTQEELNAARGQLEALTAPQPEPEVQYADKVVEAQPGFRLEKEVLSHYFGNGNLNAVIEENAGYNNVAVGDRLEDGQTMRLRLNFGAELGVQDVEYTAKAGDSIREVVNRAMRAQVNAVAEANDLNVDDRAVVSVGYARDNGFEVLKYVVEGKDEYSDNDLAVVRMVDGEFGDRIQVGDQITLPGYTVVVESGSVPQGVVEASGDETRHNLGDKNLASLEIRAEVTTPENTTLPEDSILKAAYRDLMQIYKAA